MIPDIREIDFPAYATLSTATATLNDMGERTITAQVKIDGDVTPDFTRDWTVEYGGERYVHSVRSPQALKDNTSRKSKIDLTFTHWAIDALKRYYFFEAASVAAGTVMPDKYNARIGLTLPNFVNAFNGVLDFYFGGKIAMVLNPAWQSDATPQYVEINYTHLWDVLQKVYEIYGARWTIDAVAGQPTKCNIRVGYDANEATHIFEYGYGGGLLKVERQVQSAEIKNVLLGRGGEQNLPTLYFKDYEKYPTSGKSTNGLFEPDPDAIPELKDIYFTQLRSKEFRDYVKGWKAKKYDGKGFDVTQTEAWMDGWTAADTGGKFNPVEYVRDEASIAKYGEYWGALDDNEDIYPSVQGSGYDDVVAVEQIESDEIPETVDREVGKRTFEDKSFNYVGSKHTKKTKDPTAGIAAKELEYSYNYLAPGAEQKLIYNDDNQLIKFTIDPVEGKNIVGTLTSGGFDFDCKTVSVKSIKFNAFGTKIKEVNYEYNTGLVYLNVTGVDIVVYEVGNGGSLTETSAAALKAGVNYAIGFKATVKNVSDSVELTDILLTFKSPKLITSDVTPAPNPNVFDVWVKDLWGVQRYGGESDAAYASRVWTPILGSHGEEAAVVFASGLLASSSDYDFKIVDIPVYDTSKSNGEAVSAWRLKLAKSDAELEATGLMLPNTKINAKAGDLFFFTGIEVPHKYVLWAEQRLQDYKKDSLLTSGDIQPTWVIGIDKVRANTMEAGDVRKLIDQLSVGSMIRLRDRRFTVGAGGGASGAPYVTQYVQSATYTWKEATKESPYIYPDVEVVLSDRVAAVSNPVSNLSGEVSALQRQMGSLSNLQQIIRAVCDRIYLRKDGVEDIEAGKVTFASSTEHQGQTWHRRGAVFGRDGYAGGMTGFGGRVDEYGNAEFDSMTVRRFLEVPELRYNRISINAGNSWRAPGGGIIEAVVIDTEPYVPPTIEDEDVSAQAGEAEATDGGASEITTGTIFLKLEEGETGAVAVNDICMGIYHDERDTGGNATEDADDGKGNFSFAGFSTCYFYITEVNAGAGNASFRYALRGTDGSWTHSKHPEVGMHFVAYGNFTDKDRQTSRYSTRTYERYLKDVDDWEFTARNIGAQFGDLSNLSLFGIEMEGYSAYLNNIYMKGRIEQLADNGEVVPVIVDRGVWVSGTAYSKNDDVYHGNAKWRSLVDGNDSEPAEANASKWLLLEKAVNGVDGTSYAPNLFKGTETVTTNVSANNSRGVILIDDGLTAPVDKDGNVKICVSIGKITFDLPDGVQQPEYLECRVNSILGNRFYIPVSDPAAVFSKPSSALNFSRLYIYAGSYGSTKGVTATFEKIMVNYGDRPVAWTPAASEMIGKPGAPGADGNDGKDGASYTENLFSYYGDGTIELANTYFAPDYGFKQKAADSAQTYEWKLQARKGDGRTNIVTLNIDSAGEKVIGFEIPDSLGGCSFALLLNGRSVDTGVIIHTPDVFTAGAYTLSFHLQQLTNGGVAFKRLKIERGANANPVWSPSYKDMDGVPLTPNLLKGSKTGIALTGADYPDKTAYSSTVNDDGFLEFTVTATADAGSGTQTRYKFVRNNLTRYYKDGGTYTLSAEVKSDTPFYFEIDSRTEQNGNVVTIGNAFQSTGGVWRRVSVTGTMNGIAGNTTSLLLIRLCKYLDGSGSAAADAYCTIRKVCLTEGRSAEYQLTEKEANANSPMLRQSEWLTDIEYRNDEALFDEPRYVDIALVKDASVSTGLRAFKCLKTHTSSSSNKPVNNTTTEYWSPFNIQDPIITPIIIAKNAVLDFMQGNQLLIHDASGNVAAGLVGKDVCLWTGATAAAAEQGNAPFYAKRDGSVYASKLTITGESTFKGIIKCFNINIGSYTDLNTYFTYSGGRYNLNLAKVASFKTRITFNMAQTFNISLIGIQGGSKVGYTTGDIRDYLGSRILFVNRTSSNAINFFGAVHTDSGVSSSSPIVILSANKELDVELKSYNKSSYLNFEWDIMYNGNIMNE